MRQHFLKKATFNITHLTCDKRFTKIRYMWVYTDGESTEVWKSSISVWSNNFRQSFDGKTFHLQYSKSHVSKHKKS